MKIIKKSTLKRYIDSCVRREVRRRLVCDEPDQIVLQKGFNYYNKLKQQLQRAFGQSYKVRNETGVIDEIVSRIRQGDKELKSLLPVAKKFEEVGGLLDDAHINRDGIYRLKRFLGI